MRPRLCNDDLVRVGVHSLNDGRSLLQLVQVLVLRVAFLELVVQKRPRVRGYVDPSGASETRS